MDAIIGTKNIIPSTKDLIIVLSKISLFSLFRISLNIPITTSSQALNLIYFIPYIVLDIFLLQASCKRDFL